MTEHYTIKNIFEGQSTTTIFCTNCQKETTFHQMFNSLHLDIPDNIHPKIEEVVQKLQEQEILNDWRCNHCYNQPQSHSQSHKPKAYKRTVIKYLPRVVIMQIKGLVLKGYGERKI